MNYLFQNFMSCSRKTQALFIYFMCGYMSIEIHTIIVQLYEIITWSFQRFFNSIFFMWFLLWFLDNYVILWNKYIIQIYEYKMYNLTYIYLCTKLRILQK